MSGTASRHAGAAARKKIKYADVAELADAPDLGSGISDVQVQVLSSAPTKRLPEREAFLFAYIQRT